MTDYTPALLAVALATSVTALIYALRLRRQLTTILEALDSRALRRYLREVEVRRRGRDRKRFIVFKLLAGEGLSEADVEELIKESFKKLFGTTTLAIAGVSLAYYDPERGAGVVRVRASHKNHAIVALSAVDVITDGKVIIQPTRTTGTLRKAMRYAES